jgi:hypothetical protein
MTQKDTVNVIEGTRKYSAQVSDRWMTRVTDVPSGSRGARLIINSHEEKAWAYEIDRDDRYNLILGRL